MTTVQSTDGGAVSPSPTESLPDLDALDHAGGGQVSTVAQRDAEGWVTARPPRFHEIVRRVFGFPGLLRRHKDLVLTSVKRDLEVRFSGTILGWFWPLFHPLFLFVVYYFIFVHLLGFKLQGLPESQKSGMGVYMFVGISAWTAIAETLVRGTSSIVDNGNLIKKLAFPSEILPLNVTLVGLVTLLFAVAMFVVACTLTPMWPAPGWALLWVPVILLVQGVFTYGLALFLSTLQVFLRDTLQVVTVLTTVWMFATPIFWVPEVTKRVADYMPILSINPVYHLVQAWRGALMGDVVIPKTPEIAGGLAVSVEAIGPHLAVLAAWAVGFYVLGFAFFVLCQRRFADEV
ncbi:MAG TPA: ABC transporter permease [Planctomycetes bacterium]|nr:ABC transporter permease [Planctomycetota bacterium]